jgi:hypothetical protein
MFLIHREKNIDVFDISKENIPIFAILRYFRRNLNAFRTSVLMAGFPDTLRKFRSS